MAANDSALALPRFYMYTDPVLDFGWMRECTGFDRLRDSARGEGLGEVGLRSALVAHESRTERAAEATLFYVPIWEYTSIALGECNGTNHTQRMHRAARALEASDAYVTRGGADHFWGTSKSLVFEHEMRPEGGAAESSGRYLDIVTRIGPLAHAFRAAIVGRYKYFQRGSTRSVGACSFEMPYMHRSRRASQVVQPPHCLVSLPFGSHSLPVPAQPRRTARGGARVASWRQSQHAPALRWLARRVLHRRRHPLRRCRARRRRRRAHDPHAAQCLRRGVVRDARPLLALSVHRTGGVSRASRGGREARHTRLGAPPPYRRRLAVHGRGCGGGGEAGRRRHAPSRASIHGDGPRDGALDVLSHTTG